MTFLRLFGHRSAQSCTYSRKQLIRAERFCDVVIGAGIESRDLDRFFTLDRKHDDRNPRLAPNFTAKLNAIHSWHSQICNDQVRRPILHFEKSFLAVAGSANTV